MIDKSCPEFCCSFCNSTMMQKVIDFGNVALAGAFLKQSQFAEEQKYPLRVFYCSDCYALQVVDKISSNTLFQDYFYFSSAINTLSEHFKAYAEEVTLRFLNPKNATVLEFGCNDGVLLKPLADNGIRTVIGVDPAKNVLATINDPRVRLINDFFTEEVADNIIEQYGHVDLIMANNVYAHIQDIQGVTRAIEKSLHKDGVFIFEVHYLDKIITEMQYDMIYHEHLYYYSLLSVIKHFERYNMMVFDVKPIPIHAGSMRFYVCKNNSRYSHTVSSNVEALAQEERKKGFDRFDTFVQYSNEVMLRRINLMNLLESLKKHGYKIAGYGASGRANTMIQYCEINHKHIDYIIDDAPAKSGYYTPGSHFEIFPSSKLLEDDAPDYLLVFAWSFFDEIKKRNANFIINGGHMILPLPLVTIFPEIVSSKKSIEALSGVSI
jgi:methylation protein EvaC